MHRSQRTGLRDLAHEPRHGVVARRRPRLPSAFDEDGIDGSAGGRLPTLRRRGRRRRAPCSACGTRLPPAARSRARAPAGSRRAAAIALAEPAATTWPPPLTFAGVRPSASEGLRRPRPRSPPRTAAIDVGSDAAAAAGHRGAARRARGASASASVSTPARAAAANSPTRVAGDNGAGHDAVEQSAYASRARWRREAAAQRRCRGSCRRPTWCRGRRGRRRGVRQRRRGVAATARVRATGSSIPGVCAPWPGQTMASMGQECLTLRRMMAGSSAHRLAGTIL